MAAPQSRSVAPETFLLDQDAQQSLPPDAIVALQQVDNLKYFLISAPVDWQPDQYIRRFLLPTGEYVSCVLWNNLFHITGTDIVRCLSFRFQAFGRPVKNSKKFEEGIFSDLRNLKAGTDASLEEPKSAFLDFLYKNNCIRTQKKQKVFYWYSVPHDRLFLDALERDLKREKIGQESTTMAVSEPALSFQFDSSQSLFEQLTKAQQTSSSSFSNLQPFAHQNPPSSSSHPHRSMDSMPPPMIPQTIQAPPSQSGPPPPASAPEEHVDPLAGYTQMALSAAASAPSTAAGTPQPMHREREMSQVQYDRNGIPLSQIHQRHSSVPAYLEYSPAPSFVSSHYDDYSTRAMSFEPITPPHHSMSVGSEPAYIANEDTGLYTAIPDLCLSANINNPFLPMPPSQLCQFGAITRPFQPPSVYSVIEGSPTYKQRRRRSSLSAGPGAMAAVTASTGSLHAAHKPSDLRRSTSISVMPVEEVDESGLESPHGTSGGFPMNMTPHQQHTIVEMSRHGTPLATVETSPTQPVVNLYGQEQDVVMPNGEYSDPHQLHAASRTVNPGAIRRARSATMGELGPYPQKSHSCPIPTCGRLFKRLEHLKRHVRTHTQERPYVCSLCNKAFSRSDNLAQHKRTHEANKDGDQSQSTSPIMDDDHELLDVVEEENNLMDGGKGLGVMPTDTFRTSPGARPSFAWPQVASTLEVA